MKNKSLLAAVFGAIAVLAPLAAGAKDWTHVKVGIEGAFPPWNLMDSSGKLAGFDVDLINNLCSRAKVDCELIAGEWNACAWCEPRRKHPARSSFCSSSCCR